MAERRTPKRAVAVALLASLLAAPAAHAGWYRGGDEDPPFEDTVRGRIENAAKAVGRGVVFVAKVPLYILAAIDSAFDYGYSDCMQKVGDERYCYQAAENRRAQAAAVVASAPRQTTCQTSCFGMSCTTTCN